MSRSKVYKVYKMRGLGKVSRNSLVRTILFVSAMIVCIVLCLLRAVPMTNMSSHVAAISLGPRMGSKVDFPIPFLPRRSAMMLVDEDGTAHSVSNGAMFNQVPVWNSDGLYFSDEFFDHHISPQGKRTQTISMKIDNIQYGHPQFVGDTQLAFYDGGRDGDGVRNIGGVRVHQVISHPLWTEHRDFKTSNFGYTTQCDGDVYAINNDFAYLSGESSLTLHKFDSRNSWKYSKITHPIDYDFHMDAASNNFVPCQAGKIYFIATGATADENKSHSFVPYLATWNVRTNQINVQKIPFNPDVFKYQFSFEEAFMDTTYLSHLRNGKIVIASHSRGEIYSIDPDTAHVELLARPYEFILGEQNMFSLKETAHHFMLLHRSLLSDNDALELIVYNRDTFAEEKRIHVSVPGWSRDDIDDAIINFAPNPNY